MPPKVDPKKVEAERLQKILIELLKEEENKYCADCQGKTPRWASFNLGVFICIRCAGFHRKLGVHISKVRSVNLDSWTVDQVRGMQEMGNERAKAIYEATLPDNFRRPTSDDHMEQFIRAKYEQKRYYSKDGQVPPPRRVAVSANGTTLVKNSKPAAPEPSLLDFSCEEPVKSACPAPSFAADFGALSLNSPSTAAVDDDPFGEFVSATPSGAGNLTKGFANFDATPSASSNDGFATFSVAPSNQCNGSEDLFGSVTPTVNASTVPTANGGSTDLFGLTEPTHSSPSNDLMGLSVGTTAISPQINGTSQVSPSGAAKSNADIMALFGGSSASSTSTFSALPTGGFPATAYGLSQFTSPPVQSQQLVAPTDSLAGISFAPMGNAQFPVAAPPMLGTQFGMAMNTQNHLSGGPVPHPAAPPAPRQTRAMAAFDGIDKGMFISAAHSKPTTSIPPKPATTVSQVPVTAQSSNTDDLFGLF